LNTPIATTHDGKRILLFGGRLWVRMSGGDSASIQNLQFLNPHSSLTRPVFVLFYPINTYGPFS
jgi:hypothetical protein